MYVHLCCWFCCCILHEHTDTPAVGYTAILLKAPSPRQREESESFCSHAGHRPPFWWLCISVCIRTAPIYPKRGGGLEPGKKAGANLRQISWHGTYHTVLSAEHMQAHTARAGHLRLLYYIYYVYMFIYIYCNIRLLSYKNRPASLCLEAHYADKDNKIEEHWITI